MHPTTTIEYLPWDSSFFNRSIGRITGHNLDESSVHQILESSISMKLDCIYFLADAQDSLTLQLASQSGFHMVDIRATLNRHGTPITSQHAHADGIEIQTANAEDIPVLEEIARNSFQTSRFYSDSHFPRHLCDQLYATWIRQSVEDKAQSVFIARMEDGIVGFMSSLERDNVGELSLMGIQPRVRRRGIGTLLVQAALLWFAGMNIDTVTVVTQGSNIAAQRLFQNEGFRTSNVQIWFHKWFEQN